MLSLGYCQARVAGMFLFFLLLINKFLGKPSEGRPYTYRPFRPGPITRYLLDRNTSDYGKREEDVKHTKIFR